MRSGELDAARIVFEENATLFPHSYNTWDSLGEVQMRLGNHDEALAFYERSLELNATNPHAIEAVARLRGQPSADH